MQRDIDRIIDRLSIDAPSIQVRQLQVRHPGNDDDGIWFFSIPGKNGEVQLESSDGTCPFLVESDCDDKRVEVQTVEEAVVVVKRLHGLT
jgi:hypothetical protein